ncbi:MAG: hypothetical protein ABL908_23060, partial [Hyphomicrobium sp.]
MRLRGRHALDRTFVIATLCGVAVAVAAASAVRADTSSWTTRTDQPPAQGTPKDQAAPKAQQPRPAAKPVVAAP